MKRPLVSFLAGALAAAAAFAGLYGRAAGQPPSGVTPNTPPPPVVSIDTVAVAPATVSQSGGLLTTYFLSLSGPTGPEGITYRVPPGKALLITAITASGQGQSLTLERFNSTGVGRRVALMNANTPGGTGNDPQTSLSQAFPSGIVFRAGETMRVRTGAQADLEAYVYGHFVNTSRR